MAFESTVIMTCEDISPSLSSEKKGDVLSISPEISGDEAKGAYVDTCNVVARDELLCLH